MTDHFESLINKFLNKKAWANAINSSRKVGTSNNFNSYEFNPEVENLEIPFFEIPRIQSPEPHSYITDYYLHKYDWVDLRELIIPFYEEAYISFNIGLYNSCIASSINCLEYILKYELLRHINMKSISEANKKYNEHKLTLGSFLSTESDFANNLKIDNFQEKLQIINNIRNGFFHFNVNKLIKASQYFSERIQGSTLVSGTNEQLEVAYFIYITITEVITYFYNSEKSKEYYLEAINDYELKREEIIKWMNSNNIVGGVPMEQVFDNKCDFMKSQLEK